MKYLLVAVVVLVAIWWLRAKLSGDDRPGKRGGARTASQVKPEAMLACHHCGVHVAASEAVSGRLGSYCGEPHRRADEPD